jgi:hypothetical protein
MADRNAEKALAAVKLAEAARRQAFDEAASAIEHDAPVLAERIRALKDRETYRHGS